MKESIRGGWAGAGATLPMSLFMLATFPLLPKSDQTPLPPRKITGRALGKVGLRARLDESQKRAVTLMNHFSYGALMGAAYAVLFRSSGGSPALRGAAWGSTVWLGSYLGLMPVLGLHRAATKEPWPRNLLMIAAHWVWGISMATLMDRRSPAKRATSRLVARAL